MQQTYHPEKYKLTAAAVERLAPAIDVAALDALRGQTFASAREFKSRLDALHPFSPEELKQIMNACRLDRIRIADNLPALLQNKKTSSKENPAGLSGREFDHRWQVEDILKSMSTDGNRISPDVLRKKTEALYKASEKITPKMY